MAHYYQQPEQLSLLSTKTNFRRTTRKRRRLQQTIQWLWVGTLCWLAVSSAAGAGSDNEQGVGNATVETAASRSHIRSLQENVSVNESRMSYLSENPIGGGLHGILDSKFNPEQERVAQFTAIDDVSSNDARDSHNHGAPILNQHVDDAINEVPDETQPSRHLVTFETTDEHHFRQQDRTAAVEPTAFDQVETRAKRELTELSALASIRAFFGEKGRRTTTSANNGLRTGSIPTMRRSSSSGTNPPFGRNITSTSSDPNQPPFEGNFSGSPPDGGGGGGMYPPPINGNFSVHGDPSGNFSGGDGHWDHNGGGGGNNDQFHSEPGKRGAPKFNGCQNDFFEGVSDCNTTEAMYGPSPPLGNRSNETFPDHGDVPRPPPSGASFIPQNEIELGVSVWVAPPEQVILLDQVASVVKDLLNRNTSFHVVDDADKKQERNGRRKSNKDSIWLKADPYHTNVTFISTITSSTSSSEAPVIWQKYALGYQCFRGRTPIADEETIHRIFSISQSTIDASIVSGTFASELRGHLNVSGVDIQGVAIVGKEAAYASSSQQQQPTFDSQLSTTGWDARRLAGMSMLGSTIFCTLVLMHFGARWEEKKKKETVWGIPLGTEQDVGNLLNMGFIWKQGEGHEGPPKGIVVFNKQKIGYRDDDSMLMGGFQDVHEVVDTTLPSSATSWEGKG